MSILNFTVEEINLIDIYCKPNPPRRTATKTETITRIAESYNSMDDCMKEIAMTAAMKLSYLSDEEFDKTVFTPAD